MADDFSDGIELAFYDCEKGICTGKTFANGGSGSPRRGPNFVAPISHEEPAQAIHRLVPSAVATTLEMRTEDPRLVAGLRDKRMLLLLDNSSMSQYHRITDLERAGRLDLTCRILDADALSKW